MLTGILLANGRLPAAILTSLFTDNIVKEGIAASFAVKLFKAWMAEKDANSVTSSLRKANLDKRLLELFPANRQNVEHFAKYFTDAGLKELSDFLRVQQSLGTRKELQKELQERLSQECPVKEVERAFQKIVVLFYKADVLSEEAILKWYKEAHLAKGKSVFLDQMKKFVEWLQNAEEGTIPFKLTVFSSLLAIPF
uniref:eIF5-mimic protein 1 n=1 Tax=Chelydra serpentina TaxID=8475 RepID=A0A8C3SJB5_CHESE